MWFRRLCSSVLFVLISVPLFLSAAEGNKFDTAQFFQSILEADAVFIGEYLQGGQTKARIAKKKDLFGSTPADLVVTDIDNQKHWLKYRFAYQPRTPYVFIVNKKGDAYMIHRDSVSIPVMSDRVNFS
ncbi:MAG TPA: hypothetical protein P5077_14315, partial [bacterium]|nr:hypothetical protein [bacterium]